MSENKLHPNTTQTPNVLLDHLMPYLSGAEFKVLMYVVRRTYGFHKDKDKISLTQFENGITSRGVVLDHGTGLSRKKITTAKEKLVKLGVLTEEDTYTKTYNFNTNLDIEQLVKKLHQCSGYTKSSVVTTPKVVKQVHPQKKEKQRERVVSDETTSSSAGQVKPQSSNEADRYGRKFSKPEVTGRLDTESDGTPVDKSQKKMKDEMKKKVDWLIKRFNDRCEYHMDGYKPDKNLGWRKHAKRVVKKDWVTPKIMAEHIEDWFLDKEKDDEQVISFYACFSDYQMNKLKLKHDVGRK